MKQFAFMVEVVLTSKDEELFLVRNPKGQIEKICQNPQELASFFEESIKTFKNLFKDGK